MACSHRVLGGLWLVVLSGVTVSAQDRSGDARPDGVPAAVRSGDDLRVLEARNAKIAVRDYLLRNIHEQYETRRHRVAAALSSPDSVRQYQRSLRERYAQLIGTLPRKTPLNAVVTGAIPCEGYNIDRVAFESRPGLHVTANLYVPTDRPPPFPGVLVPCGHSAAGKAYEAYQSVAILLAQNGLMALVYDPLGQGERRQLSGRRLSPGERHKLLNVNSILVGRHFVNYSVWDGVRALDYLQTRSELNQSRPIGVTGNSGGGAQTMYLMALDDRVGPAAPSCHITTLERNFELGGAGDGCQSPPLTGALRFEHPDFFILRAPKPSIILAAERDYKDINFTRQTFREAQQAYRQLDATDRMDMFTYDDTHAFSKPRRQAAVRWMRRWLLDDPRPVVEAKLKLQPQRSLNVTATGSVLESFPGARSVVDINIELTRSLAAERARFWRSHTTDECSAKIRKLVGVRDELEQPRIQAKGTIQRTGYRIEKLLIQRKDEPPVPAFLMVPNAAEPKRPATIYVEGRGKVVDASPSGAAERLVNRGEIVLSIDVRGFGETADEGGKAPYARGDHRLAMWSLHIGRPLLGQRVEDVLAARTCLIQRDDVDVEHIRLVGIGRGGPVVLHAAAMEPGFCAVTTRDSIDNWIDAVLARPTEPDAIGCVIPGSLHLYDLPDLVRVLKRAGRIKERSDAASAMK